MAIKLVVERYVKSNGVKGYIVKSFDLLRESKLPKMYLDKKPNCYKTTWPTRIILNGEEWREIREGDFLTEEELQDILAFLRVCGNRLKKINEKLSQMREEWNGIEEFEI